MSSRQKPFAELPLGLVFQKGFHDTPSLFCCSDVVKLHGRCCVARASRLFTITGKAVSDPLVPLCKRLFEAVLDQPRQPMFRLNKPFAQRGGSVSPPLSQVVKLTNSE